MLKINTAPPYLLLSQIPHNPWIIPLNPNPHLPLPFIRLNDIMIVAIRTILVGIVVVLHILSKYLFAFLTSKCHFLGLG
jgi:hypothetical protein